MKITWGFRKDFNNPNHWAHVAYPGFSIGYPFCMYNAAQNDLQTESDSGALAAVQELWHSSSTSAVGKQSDAQDAAAELVENNFAADSGVTADPSDVVFGYIDPTAGRVDASTFTTPSSSTAYTTTGGYKAVQVKVRKTEGVMLKIPTIMANLFGIGGMDATAPPMQ